MRYFGPGTASAPSGTWRPTRFFCCKPSAPQINQGNTQFQWLIRKCFMIMFYDNIPLVVNYHFFILLPSFIHPYSTVTHWVEIVLIHVAWKLLHGVVVVMVCWCKLLKEHEVYYCFWWHWGFTNFEIPNYLKSLLWGRSLKTRDAGKR